MLRKLLRARAKEDMRKKGMRQICKKSKKGGAGKHTSYFAMHWRDHI